MTRQRIIKCMAACIMCSLLCGCAGTPDMGGQASGAGASADAGKISIVTTIFPEYDWVMNIMGDRAPLADVELLMDNGVDMHSFQPAADDILKISSCDMFIYVGGESDEWVNDALAEAVNPDMVVINMMDALGDRVKDEETVEGMEAEADHDEAEADHDEAEADHDEAEADHDEAGTDHDEEHGAEAPESDEHVWLSLRNAAVLCDAITDALCTVDPEGADVYKANNLSYRDELTALDRDYMAAVDASQNKTLLFADRFPFRYMTDDYGLDYYAAFAGCSAETEASFETVIFLADKTDELGLGSVMTIDGNDGKLARTIIENTSSRDQKILTLNSMQGVTSRDMDSGTTYLSVMRSNLEVLEEALK